jgi:hypothetical protein
MRNHTIKEGDFVINTERPNDKPRKVDVYSSENNTLGFHQPYGWFQWVPIGRRHEKHQPQLQTNKFCSYCGKSGCNGEC